MFIAHILVQAGCFTADAAKLNELGKDLLQLVARVSQHHTEFS